MVTHMLKGFPMRTLISRDNAGNNNNNSKDRFVNENKNKKNTNIRVQLELNAEHHMVRREPPW
jgi:hypothetical protein